LTATSCPAGPDPCPQPLQLACTSPPNKIVELSGRYRQRTRNDDEVFLRVFHRTTGGPVSVALGGPAAAATLAAWITSGEGGIRTICGTQTTAELTRHDDALHVVIGWNGSGRGHRVVLNAGLTAQVAAWLSGWATTSWTPALLSRRTAA
jgi:hypothetical protein